MLIQLRYSNNLRPLVVLMIGLLFVTILPARAGVPPRPRDGDGQSPKVIFKPEPSRPFVAGDGVQISTYPDTLSFLHNTFPIDDDGYVDLPLYGKVKIIDMSKEDFEAFLKEYYRDYLRFPNVQIKPMIRASILGGVRFPNMYYIDPDRSLWDLLRMAGGTIDEDGLKKMRWERDRKTVDDNLIPYLQSGISLRKMGFRSGDQIWVRTPTKPTVLRQIRDFLPIISLGITLFTIWYTIQRDRTRRR